MNEQTEHKPADPESPKGKLEALVPKDMTARKRILAAMLRALNTDNNRA